MAPPAAPTSSPSATRMIAGTREARAAAREHRRRPARLQRRADRQPRWQRGPALLLDRAAQQLHQLRLAPDRQLRHRRGLAVPARAARRRTAVPAAPRARPFHDHWLAVVAMARGEIAYVDEPLYDYVQHHDAVIGHSMANKQPRPIRRASGRAPTQSRRAARASSTSTTGTSSCSSPRCCGCAAGTGWRPPSAGPSAAALGRQRGCRARVAPGPPCAAALGPRRDA